MASSQEAPQQYGQPPAQDPGRTLGIVGLVLAIVASVVGLIISIVAYTKSKKAGFKNGIALAGIIVGIVTTLGSIGFGVTTGVAAYSLYQKCAELGSGPHVEGGVTYNCP